MTDKVQLIKQEIERLLKKNEHNQHNDSIQESLDKASKCRVLYELLQFIDSLSEEPASEDLEEELHSWMRENCDDNGFFNQLDLARHFAEWQKHQMKEVLQTEYEKGRFDMREEMMKDAVLKTE